MSTAGNRRRIKTGRLLPIILCLFSHTTLLKADESLQIDIELRQQVVDSMVRVEAGEFIMGTDDEAAHFSEKPAHKVKLDAFYISRFEVTQAIFKDVLGYSRSYFGCDACPEDTLSWLDAKAFIVRLNEMTGLNLRLPTEAEWEYAAKGGHKAKKTEYAGSDRLKDVAWHAANAAGKTHPVGLKQANELGLFDMTGNVLEWVEDVLNQKYYQRSPSLNPINTSREKQGASLRVLRGGGFENNAAESSLTFREGDAQGKRLTGFGMRLAASSLDLKPSAPANLNGQ